MKNELNPAGLRLFGQLEGISECYVDEALTYEPVVPLWKTILKWGGIAAAFLFILADVIIIGPMLTKKPPEIPAGSETTAESSPETAPGTDATGKRLPITMTIAETLPSCETFEYKDGAPYCFYAFDGEGKLYRVLWNDFTGLHEKDVIVVDHNDLIIPLTYDDYPVGGWTPRYEITAIDVKKENEPGTEPVTEP